MVRVMTVVGARPQFIKAAVVSRAFRERGGIEEVMVHTGQHFDANMSATFFDELSIPEPQYNLGVGGGTHAQNTGRMMEGLERIIGERSPELVVVFGDTDSTLAGALSAAKLCVPVAHVEAGLRSFNRRMPEEVNRVLTDHVAELLFVPSGQALANLAREGVAGDCVKMVGDVMYDAVLAFTEIAQRRVDPLGRYRLQPGAYALATLHRKENTDEPGRLRPILEGLARSPYEVVLPLHPRTRRRLAEFGIEPGGAVRIIDPVGYLEMLMLERHARLIATDSGGVQKEAYFHGVPCVTLRNETEWVELVQLGVNVLVGTDANAIAEAMHGHPIQATSGEIYGDGTAATRIAAIVAEY
jgi:UDP-GlcNAc3NAcA epimerase